MDVILYREAFRTQFLAVELIDDIPSLYKLI